MAVGLQAGEEDVEEPQAQEEKGGQESGQSRTAELTANGGSASEQENGHADESEDGEECDGEGQWSRVHSEFLPLDFPIDCSHRPSHADPKEHINSIATGDVTNRSISMLVLYGGHFASKGIWNKRERWRK